MESLARVDVGNECQVSVVVDHLTWSGTATSAATKARIPLKQLFVATAVDERPTLASTMYVRVMEYIHLCRCVNDLSLKKYRL